MRELPADAFSHPITNARARALGVGRRELQGPLWRTAFRGVYVWAGTEPGTRQRIRAAAELLPPDGAIGGWAACHLLGAKGLDGRSSSGADVPVVLVVPSERRIVARPGIAVLRTRLGTHDVVHCEDLPVTTPLVSTFTHMRLSGFQAAVACGDAMLNAGLVQLEELRAYVASHPRVKGVPIARKAVQLLDGAARSPQESMLRLVWVLDAGLPQPLVNRPVYGDLGQLLGIPDLLEQDSGLIAEYDGAGHREAAQHSSDNAREEELERAGFTVVRVTGLDLANSRRRVVYRLRAAYRQGLARDRRRDRWSLLPTPRWVSDPPSGG